MFRRKYLQTRVICIFATTFISYLSLHALRACDCDRFL